MNTVDSNKIAFITCVNNEAVYEECLFYLKQLNVPDGMELEFMPVFHAESMASGYNQAMGSSNAKYKVYLHQDVFILNKDFIRDCLACFGSDGEIGMLGVLGSNTHLSSGNYLRDWNVGTTCASSGDKAFVINKFLPPKPYCEVEAIDGMLMVTQKDVFWREDIFKDFDFYDVSQSMEFMRKGYKVVIPPMDHYWCMHDCGKSTLKNFEKNRKFFCDEYKQMGYVFEVNEYLSLSIQLEEKVRGFLVSIEQLLQNELYERALSFAHELYTNFCITTEIIYLNNLYEIYHAAEYDESMDFFKSKHSYRELADSYNAVKFMLRRLGTGLVTSEYAREYFAANHISDTVIGVIARHSLLHQEVLLVENALTLRAG